MFLISISYSSIKHTSGGINITTKTEVVREAHELQISGNNRPAPSKSRQPIAFRPEDASADPEAMVHGDGLSLDSDVTGYGDGSKW